MQQSTLRSADASRLIILLNSISLDALEMASIPFRYAVTAAAMDVAVEVHAVSRSVALFRRSADAPELLIQIRQAVELGVEFFACLSGCLPDPLPVVC